MNTHLTSYRNLQKNYLIFSFFPAKLSDLTLREKMSPKTVEKIQTQDLKEYKAFFKEIKEKILTSQVKAALAVNHELIHLYWEIGSKIHLK